VDVLFNGAGERDRRMPTRLVIPLPKHARASLRHRHVESDHRSRESCIATALQMALVADEGDRNNQQLQFWQRQPSGLRTRA